MPSLRTIFSFVQWGNCSTSSAFPNIRSGKWQAILWISAKGRFTGGHYTAIFRLCEDGGNEGAKISIMSLFYSGATDVHFPNRIAR
jgi:hypothetical protein